MDAGRHLQGRAELRRTVKHIFHRHLTIRANSVGERSGAGGLNGKKIRLIKYDPQSSIELYAQYAQEAALKEKVDLVHGAITSASREAIRPILRRYKTLLWYSVIYEGGVCDINNFVSGVGAVQWVKPIAEFGFEHRG
ncbi:MAG: transporter substrate-binding protein, partial [Alphaproteobacteria bacterium]|nr:transporter substrate-binding protein [Alphaproteobacteria bacterium]